MWCAAVLCACDSGAGSGPVLSFVSATPTSVTLSWTSASDRVHLERATGPFLDDPFVRLATLSATTYTDSTLTDAAPRRYRITEVGPSGRSASSAVLAVRFPRQETTLQPEIDGTGVFSADGQTVYVTPRTNDGVAVYDVATGRRTGTLEGASRVAGVLADGRVAAVAYEGGALRRVLLYRANALQSEVALSQPAQPCEAPVYAPAVVSADGRVLASSCGFSGTGRVWDLAAPGAPSVRLVDASFSVSGLAPDASFAIVGVNSGGIGRASLPQGRTQWTVDRIAAQFARLNPDGRTLVVERAGIEPSAIVLLDAADGRVLASRPGRSPIGYSRDGSLVLHVAARNGVQLARAATLAPVFGLDTGAVDGAYVTGERVAVLAGLPQRLIRYDLRRAWEVAP